MVFRYRFQSGAERVQPFARVYVPALSDDSSNLVLGARAIH